MPDYEAGQLAIMCHNLSPITQFHQIVWDIAFLTLLFATIWWWNKYFFTPWMDGIRKGWGLFWMFRND